MILRQRGATTPSLLFLRELLRNAKPQASGLSPVFLHLELLGWAKQQCLPLPSRRLVHTEVCELLYKNQPNKTNKGGSCLVQTTQSEFFNMNLFFISQGEFNLDPLLLVVVCGGGVFILTKIQGIDLPRFPLSTRLTV